MAENVGQELVNVGKGWKPGICVSVSSPKLTSLQEKFLFVRPECRTDKEAADKIGIHPQTVNNWKGDGPPFPETYNKLMYGLAAVQEDAVEEAILQIRAMFPKALERLLELVDSKSEHVRLKAVELILSRGGVAAMQDVNLRVHGRLEAHLIALRQIGDEE